MKDQMLDMTKSDHNGTESRAAPPGEVRAKRLLDRILQDFQSAALGGTPSSATAVVALVLYVMSPRLVVSLAPAEVLGHDGGLGGLQTLLHSESLYIGVEANTGQSTTANAVTSLPAGLQSSLDSLRLASNPTEAALELLKVADGSIDLLLAPAHLLIEEEFVDKLGALCSKLCPGGLIGFLGCSKSGDIDRVLGALRTAMPLARPVASWDAIVCPTHTATTSPDLLELLAKLEGNQSGDLDGWVAAGAAIMALGVGERARSEPESTVRSLRKAKEDVRLLQADMEGLWDALQRLDREKETIRSAAQAEIDRLNDELTEVRRRGQAEIDRLNTELQHKGGVRLMPRLRSIASRLAVWARHTSLIVARPAGRRVLASLPVSDSTRLRLKFGIVRRFGHLYGMDTSWTDHATPTSPKEIAGPDISDKCLGLATIATGLPDPRPRRSVSIVIPVYNQISYTLRCLEAVRECTRDLDYQIIVVDDCSSDQTALMLSARRDITYIRNATNLGFIGACNAGARAATKNYVCFLNNDTEVCPGWMSALLNTFDTFEHVGLVGSKLVYPDGRLQEAGGIIWADFSGWNWGRLGDRNAPAYNYARQVDYCSGAAIVVPRALFRALGGFDSHFAPAYGEDSDLAFKVRALGLKTLYQPLSLVIHHEGITSGTDTTRGVKAYQVANAKKLQERWRHVLEHQGKNGENPHLAVDRGVRGRILVIDQITPEPDKDAGSITALEIMRALRDLGVKVTFVPCSNYAHITPYTDTLSSLGIQSVLGPWNGSLRSHLRARGTDYDAVMIFRLPSVKAHLAEVRALAPQARVIFHPSDLHFIREEREKSIKSEAAPSTDASIAQTRRAELEAIAASSATIVHSTYEKEVIENLLPDARVEVFPWIFEPQGRGLPFSRRKGIGFLGGYRHAPNVDAVMYFVSEIFPLIQRDIPGVSFYAIGSNPPQELKALQNENVHVMGFVDDLKPVLSGLRLAVAPLRYGAGLKGKIVTTLAHGVPTVTTSIGAEGMELSDGTHVLIGDDPKTFAAHVSALYRNEGYWQKLADAGYDHVIENYSREKGMRTVARVLEHAQVPYLGARVQGLSGQVYDRYGTPQPLTTTTGLAVMLQGALARHSGESGASYLWLSDGVPIQKHSSFDAVVTPADPPSEPVACLAAVFPWGNERDLVTRIAAAAQFVRPGGVMCFAVLMPTLRLDGDGYRMLRNGTQELSSNIALPVDGWLVGALAAMNIPVTVEVDTTLTGFPSAEIFIYQAP